MLRFSFTSIITLMYLSHLTQLLQEILFWAWSGFGHRHSGLSSQVSLFHKQRYVFDSQVRKIPWRRTWQPTPVFLSGESYGQRSLVGYSSWAQRVRHNLATKPPHPRDSRMGSTCSILNSKRMPAGWLKIMCTWVCVQPSVIGKA